LAVTSYDNLRTGSTNDVEKFVSVVRDERAVDQFSVRQGWTWQPSEVHLLNWGLQGSYGDAFYDYAGTADYFGLSARYENQPDSVTRQVTAAPRGGSFAMYFSDRWRLTPRWTVEWGVRWDDQSYTDLVSDAQISPRLNLLYALNPETELRLAWGRYHQSQGIHELQVEDGLDSFWPAERADHIIAGFRRRLGKNTSLRVEAFHKDMSRVRPRFENLYDPLGVVPELQPDRVALYPAAAEASGLEISMDGGNDEWDWWATYTLAHVVDRIDGGDEPRSWDQRHAFQGGVTWSNEQWTISAATSIHTGWPTTGLEIIQTGVGPSGEIEYVARPGPRNAERLATFSSLDFRVSRTFDLPRGSLLAFVEVSNALDRDNPCCRDWDIERDEAGNPVLEHSYDYWLPFLPAIGILWEF
jgi:outer membrane receptor protein involved in Fe transport